MSSLKLYAPVESSDGDDFEFPSILPFPLSAGNTASAGMIVSRGPSLGSHRLTPILRAQMLHSNRICPYCCHAAVEPIELNDGILNRHRRPIPGTATIVGFHCHDCDAEWPAR